MLLKGPSEILVLLVNLRNGKLINLNLSFPNSLTSRYFFCNSTNLVLNEMGCFVYNDLDEWMEKVGIFECLWVYGKDPSKNV